MGVSSSVHAGIHPPPGADTPWEQTPPEQTPHGADTPRAETPWSRHPLGADTPREQTSPWEQTPSPGLSTPPWTKYTPQTKYTPKLSTPPRLSTPHPGTKYTPPLGSRLRYTVNERPVRILLECILVHLKLCGSTTGCQGTFGFIAVCSHGEYLKGTLTLTDNKKAFQSKANLPRSNVGGGVGW